MAIYNNITKKEFEEIKDCILCKGTPCMCAHCEGMNNFQRSEDADRFLVKLNGLFGKLKNVK